MAIWHGVTNIDPKYPNRSVQQDGIFYVSGLAATMGFPTLKLEWSNAYATKYPYTPWGTPATLKQLVQEASMHTVLSNPAFVRYQINVFSLVVAENNPWAGTWTKAVGDAIETEMYDLAMHLFATYPTKEFVLTNWEGDWQLLNSFNPNDGIPFSRLLAYRDYQRRRQRAVTRARADSVGSTCVVRYGIECNRVLDGSGFRVVRDVVSNVPVDVISTSTYEAIEGWTQGITNQAALQADIVAKMTEVNARIRAVAPNTPIVCGEFGFPQEATYWPGTLDAAGLTQTFVQTADALGWEGEIYWQMCSNELEFPGQPRGFNLYAMNGNSDTVGAKNAIGLYYDSIL